MSMFSAAALQTTAKTASRGPTLVVGAKNLTLKEVGVESTVAVASTIALRRFTAAGTTGTALDEVPWGSDAQAPTAAASQAPTTDHTMVNGFIRLAALPAVVGGGIIWTFGDEELEVAGGSGDGFVLTLPSGTDQVVNFYFDWEE